MMICQCGCGQEVKLYRNVYNRYILGHHNRGKPSRKRLNISKELLNNLYSIENKTTRQVAKIMNVSQPIVCSYLKEYGIHIKKQGEYPKKVFSPKISKEILHQLYIINKITTYQIAERFNLSSTTINNYLKIYDISSRRRKDYITSTNTRSKISNTLKELYRLKPNFIGYQKGHKGYRNTKMTSFECINCKNNIILPLHRYRKGGEIRKYCYDCSKLLTRFTSEKISGTGNYMFGMRGELAPGWKGGMQFEPYTQDFNSEFKNKIRYRDNNICQLCYDDLTNAIKRKIHIHHINYDKTLSIKENCILLCENCHGLTNFNRESWIKFFQNKLSLQYNYQYTQDDKLIIELEAK